MGSRSEILTSHYAKDGRQEKNAPIIKKKAVTQRSVHVHDISEVQKRKKLMDCEVQTNTRCKDRAAEQSKKENVNEWWASMCVKGT